MKKFTCSWKCFATSLLIFTLLSITIVMLAGLVIIPVIYKYKWDYYYDQVSGIVPIVGGSSNCTVEHQPSRYYMATKLAVYSCTRT